MKKWNVDLIDDLTRGLEEEQCCGIAEYSGLNMITNVDDARHLRRAAYEYDQRGLVLATTTTRGARQTNPKEKYLRGAGFTLVRKFRNPRTNNYVKLWSAKTLKYGVVDYYGHEQRTNYFRF